MNTLRRLLKDEEGQDLVEYSLLLGFVALASGAILTTLGGDLTAVYTAIDGKVAAAQGAIK